MKFKVTNLLSTKKSSAFSLVEVVVAVGIFAIAVISVVGLLVPINKSVDEVKDGDDATRVVSIIQNELQRVGLTAVNNFLTTGRTLYASRSGNKIGIDDQNAPWNVDVPDLDGDPSSSTSQEIDAQKFFEINLSANPNMPFNSATDGFLALIIEIRWPAYTADGVKLPQSAAGQQSILLFPAAITR